MINPKFGHRFFNLLLSGFFLHHSFCSQEDSKKSKVSHDAYAVEDDYAAEQIKDEIGETKEAKNLLCVDDDEDSFYSTYGCGTNVDCDDKDKNVYPGYKKTVSCGPNNNGTTEQICSKYGFFADVSYCDDPDICINGETLEETCGKDIGECKSGTTTKTCISGQWSMPECGNAYVGPSKEICDKKDNDCDGEIDEYYVCSPLDLLWRIYPDGGTMDFGSAIAIGPSGHVYGTGTSNEDILTVKYDKDGVNVWKAVYDNDNGTGDIGADIAVDGEENIFVVGTAGQEYSGSTSAIVIKHDSDGGIVWKNYFGNDNAEGTSVDVDDVGNSYVVGNVCKYGGCEMHIHKYDAESDELWKSVFKGVPGNPSISNIAIAIAVDEKEDAVYIGGGTQSAYSLYHHFLLIKYDSYWGSEMWINAYNPPINSLEQITVKGIAIDEDKIIVSSRVEEIFKEESVLQMETVGYLIRYTKEGQLIDFIGPHNEPYLNDYVGGIAIGTEKQIYAALSVNCSSNSSSDGGKLSCDFGVLAVNQADAGLTVEGISSFNDYYTLNANDVAVDEEGNIYAIGTIDTTPLAIVSNYVIAKFKSK